MVRSVFGDKLGMRSALDDLSVIEDEDLVSFFDGLEAMCDDNNGSSGKEAVERFGDLLFREAIESTGRLIKEYDLGIFEENLCDSETLFLSSGEPDSTFSDLSFEPLRECPDEFTVREREYIPYLLFTAFSPCSRDKILSDSSVEYGWILCQVSDI